MTEHQAVAPPITGSVGLRIDVDTWRGTRDGVPALCRLLAERTIRGSFFFSVGPDNMGRHLWRLLRPGFLLKMVRSKAASLYGWDILLRGTFWPGPTIGLRAAAAIRGAAAAGHEIGFHAWDHHAWQSRVDRMTAEQVVDVTTRGVALLTEVSGARPTSAAAPGWRCNDTVLRAQAAFPLTYTSDCRGESIFLPEVGGEVLTRPQIPVTLPTYDELIGRDGVTDANYNERLLAHLRPGQLNVLTVHAEVEGLARSTLFADFLDRALQAGWRFVPLMTLLPAGAELPVAPVIERAIPGRDGIVACQGRTSGRRQWLAKSAAS
jgi:undecaprenyl phosphate-alpha-L-ara4FN deformylase